MHSWMQARLMVWRFGWWWGLKRLFLEEKYTSSPYWEVIFTDEILRVFLRDLHDPMSLNKASACFSVNTLDFAKAFSSPASYSRRGTMFAGGWYIFEQKCLTSRWNGMNIGGTFLLLVIYVELIYYILDTMFLLGILSPVLVSLPTWKRKKQSIHIDVGRASLLGYFAPWKHQGESSSELRI